MREINAYKYLVIGTLYNGYTREFIKCLQQFAHYHKIDHVFHLGQVSDDTEIKMVRFRENRIRKLESIKVENDTSKTLKKKYKNQLHAMRLNEKRKVEALKKTFSSVIFVANDECFLPDSYVDCYEADTVKIGKHLVLSPVAPAGDNVSSNPGTSRAYTYWHRFGHDTSIIMPHPIPILDSMVAEGVNKAKLFVTTGSLCKTRDVKRKVNLAESAKHPGAVFVVHDEEKDQFHLDTIGCRKVDGELAIIFDGRVFFSDRVVELGSSDKGMCFKDGHGQLMHPAAFGSYKACQELHDPSVDIDGGDNGDFPGLNHHEAKNIQYRAKACNRRSGMAWRHILKNIKRGFLIGLRSNHTDRWRWDYLKQNPEWEGAIGDYGDWVPHDLYDKRYLTEQGIDKPCIWGDLVPKHGDNITFKQAHDMFNVTLLGHFHRWFKKGRASCSGAMCRHEQAYQDGRPSASILMFDVLSKYKEKSQVSSKVVMFDDHREKARFAYNGKLYECDYIDIFAKGWYDSYR